MTWLTPGLAAIAASVLAPTLVLLYFLKLRRREVEISSTFLWKKSIQDLQANAPFQKLKRNILLFLQLLVLAAGLFAVAQPEIAAPESESDRHIIVLDRSGSMSAMDVGAGGGAIRLDTAKREAIAFIDTLREPGLFGVGVRDEAMVIAFDAGAEVLQPWTTDTARLRAAVESIEPTDAPTRLDEAIRLSGAYAQPALIERTGLVSQATAPIHVWSDGRVEDMATVLLPSVTPMTYHRVGTGDVENVGITGLRAERNLDDPGKISVFVGLQSTARSEQLVEVELAIDGLVVGIRSAPVSAATDEAPGVGGVVFSMDRAEGGLARIRLTRSDALVADNTAHLVLSPAKRLAVALVSEGGLFVETALEGMTLSRFVKFTPAQFERAVSAGAAAGFDVVVMVGWAPHGPLPPGRYLIFGAIPDMAGLTSTGAREGPMEAIDWSREHPMFRYAALNNLVIAKDSAIEASADLRVLARSDVGPIVVEATDRGAHAIVTSFVPGASNWPFDPGFVVALASAVRALGDADSAVVTASVTPGEAVATRLPMGAQEVALREPGGVMRTLIPAPDGTVTFGPIRRAGVFELSWAGDAGATDVQFEGRTIRVIAANLLDAFESDVRAADTLVLASRDVAATTGGDAASDRTPLWPWLLLAALAITMLEWFVYNRRMRI